MLTGLHIVDVLPFSSRKKELYPLAKIQEYLSVWNNEPIEVLFARNFKKLFVGLSDWYMAEEDGEKQRLSRYNKALSLSENKAVSEELSALQRNVQLHIKNLKAKQEKLLQLRHVFFEKLKNIGDLKGIALPEPSELDLIETRVNIDKIIGAYNKKKGLASGDYEDLFIQFHEAVTNDRFFKGHDFVPELSRLTEIGSDVLFMRPHDHDELIENRLAHCQIENSRLLIPEQTKNLEISCELSREESWPGRAISFRTCDYESVAATEMAELQVGEFIN